MMELLGRGSAGHAFRWRLLVAMLSLGWAAVEAAPAPSAPLTSTGSYTVSYASCGGCYLSWLEERAAGSSGWTTVGTSTVTFTAKPPGAYEYRAGLVFWGAGSDYQVEYSAIATVVVGSNLPAVQTLSEQFRHEYTAKVGYYDADSRPDLFIERTRGGSGDDGTLRRLILRGTSSGFRAVVPSTAAARAARGWPRANVGLALHDVNVDGFVDVLIGGIGRLPGFSGKAPQIILAPGRVASATPKAVVPVAGDVLAFGRDVRGFLREARYFQKNAPVMIVTTTHYDVSCKYAGLDVAVYGMTEYCYPFILTTYSVVPDYTVFAAAAVEIESLERAITDGRVSPQTGFARIESLVEETLGTELGDRDLGELLGEAAGTIEPAFERGVELFAVLAGIGNAVAQEEAEEQGTGTTVADSVLLTGRRVIGFGPFHTALQYGVSTVSAYDSDARALFDGTLVSQLNWPPDHPALTMRLGSVASALPPALYWQRLVAADSGYRDNLPYDAIPGLGAGGYNSNGFVAGILRATSGVSSEPMTSFVGGEKPVPRASFN